MICRAPSVITLAVLLLATVARGAEPAAPAQPELPTYTVEAEFFKIDLLLNGIFEADRMTEVSLTLEAWSQMKVLWAADAGTEVRKGDVLVRLDTTDLDEHIRDIEAGRRLALLQLTQAEEELRLLELATPRGLDDARRAARIAQEDFEYYMKATHALKDEFQELAEEGDDLWLRSARTQLRELKKMYEADDLVETTEKLVLAREEHQVERADLNWRRAQVTHAWVRKIGQPRELEEQRRKVRDAKQALARPKRCSISRSGRSGSKSSR